MSCCVDEHELLRIGQAGRNHHFATLFQLVNQRWRNEVGSRRHDHSIERGVFRPAMIAIRNLELDVGATFPTQSSFGLFPELFNNLDAVYLPGQLCEDCSLVTKTGADLENSVISADLK